MQDARPVNNLTERGSSSNLGDYYREPKVRQRMIEFLGGGEPGGISSVYINANDASQSHSYSPRKVGDLFKCLEDRKEILRSLWDRRNLLVHLDIEYVNLDSPAAPYLEFHEYFAFQHPIIPEVTAVLLRA